jgi:3-deoxy-D-manno-octulosonate 8-phosphate phosphatase (KDO 8-P phosphatase)
LKTVKLLALDVDGTLTDGGLYLSESGESLKRFHAQDGLGIVLAAHVGLEVAWITGRKSPILERRAEALGVASVRQGIHDKAAALREISEERGIALSEMAFMGDDLNDLPALSVAGFALAPKNAVPRVLEIAHWVSSKKGGDGAVRDAIDTILTARGDEKIAEERYLASLRVQGTVQ